MARALLVGCGCRARLLGSELLADGWQVRGTSRARAGLEPIAAAGIEPALADPDRVGTVLDHLDGVTAVAWLLGSARGNPAMVSALHGPRLERLLEQLVDTPVRGFVYESRGTAERVALAQGVRLVRDAAERWRVPVAFVDADPAGWRAWAGSAREAFRAAVGV